MTNLGDGSSNRQGVEECSRDPWNTEYGISYVRSSIQHRARHCYLTYIQEARHTKLTLELTDSMGSRSLNALCNRQLCGVSIWSSGLVSLLMAPSCSQYSRSENRFRVRSLRIKLSTYHGVCNIILPTI